jgi:serine/threonine-protein kinase
MHQTGDVLAGKYRIVRELGSGAMGTVFAVHHEVLDQTVAVKVLAAEYAKKLDVVKRLLLEARAAARLDSPHVARVMDAGILDDGLPFMAMEYLEGVDLQTVLDAEGAMPVARATDFLLQALEGLSHAHAAQIVHRDLKPTNLFVAKTRDGGECLKLVDFGISKAPSRFGSLTGAGQVVGSPAYMSPEQAAAGLNGTPSPVDARTDLWSIGVVGYELLTGCLPFEAETSMATLARVLQGRMTPLAERRPDLPPDLVAVFTRCLAPDPSARYADAAALAKALAPFGSGAYDAYVARIERTLGAPKRALSERPFLLSAPKMASLPVPMVRRRRRRARSPLAIGAAAALALACAFAFRAVAARPAPAAPSGVVIAVPLAEVPSASIAAPIEKVDLPLSQAARKAQTSRPVRAAPRPPAPAPQPIATPPAGNPEPARKRPALLDSPD